MRPVCRDALGHMQEQYMEEEAFNRKSLQVNRKEKRKWEEITKLKEKYLKLFCR